MLEPGGAQTISVVMATWNGERFLSEQLHTIAMQSRPPDELVVVDDRSTDGTLDLIKRFALLANFPVAVSVNDRRRGATETFMRGLGQARGSVVAFADQDDAWRKDRIDRALKALLDAAISIVVCPARIVGADGSALGGMVPAEFRHRLQRTAHVGPWCVPNGCTLVFRRHQAMVGGGHVPLRSSCAAGPILHDEWVTLVARALGGLHVLRGVAGDYRKHGMNLSGGTGGPSLVAERLRAVSVDQYRLRVELARSRATALEALSLRHLNRPEGVSFARAAARYELLALHSEQRAHLYEASRRRSRIASLARLVVQRGYRPWPNGGLGYRSLVKDSANVIWL